MAEPCHHSRALDAAANGGEEENMNKLHDERDGGDDFDRRDGAVPVVTTTGMGHAAAVQIEPEYRTKIRSYVTEHKVRPV
jgi:hypothetical protein